MKGQKNNGGVFMTDKKQINTNPPEGMESPYSSVIAPAVDINDMACSPEFSDSCKFLDLDEDDE